MGIFYLLLIGIRFLVIGILVPILYLTGESFNWKEYLLTCWGGLRGALSLALALVVAVDVKVN